MAEDTELEWLGIFHRQAVGVFWLLLWSWLEALTFEALGPGACILQQLMHGQCAFLSESKLGNPKHMAWTTLRLT